MLQFQRSLFIFTQVIICTSGKCLYRVLFLVPHSLKLNSRHNFQDKFQLPLCGLAYCKTISNGESYQLKYVPNLLSRLYNSCFWSFILKRLLQLSKSIPAFLLWCDWLIPSHLLNLLFEHHQHACCLSPIWSLIPKQFRPQPKNKSLASFCVMGRCGAIFKSSFYCLDIMKMLVSGPQFLIRTSHNLQNK